MPESTLLFTVENQYSEFVVVYSTASKPVTTPPSSDADAYQPVYTRLGTVAPSKKGELHGRLVAGAYCCHAGD